MTGQLLGLAAAQPGLLAVVTAPPGTLPAEIAEVPPGGEVVAWALVADTGITGGATVEPVFLAAGQAWTAAQFRGRYGAALSVEVGRR